MNRRSVIWMTLGLLLAFVPVAPSRAATSETKCVWAHDVFPPPGCRRLRAPDRGHRRDRRVRRGTITCDGPVNGKQPTGPGILEARGRYGTQDGDTCQSGGEGDGVWSVIFPTAGGSEHIVALFTSGTARSQPAHRSPWSSAGDRVKGTGEVQSFEGDCAANAVTKYHAKGQVTIKG